MSWSSLLHWTPERSLISIAHNAIITLLVPHIWVVTAKLILQPAMPDKSSLTVDTAQTLTEMEGARARDNSAHRLSLPVLPIGGVYTHVHPTRLSETCYEIVEW